LIEKLGLKKLIATCHKSQEIDLFSQNNSEQAIYLILPEEVGLAW
jgi:hypothetical protein